ncbi:MAG: hypothetical protein JO316_17535 [Abitibacteriaceae bacterium]|nr:hypothetical protein [Abditibacteriaceae bacterium]MBV9867161.1 hypothetical protein [Abditibacteriaceae bacterium]
MTRTLTISDNLYNQLESEARRQGFDGIERLLESLKSRVSSPVKTLPRDEAVRQINALREQLFNKYGEMQDSVHLVREDRAR